MVSTLSSPKVTWEKLPNDFPLPDDPVDNIDQPALAQALTEALARANRLPGTAITPTNYAICATVDGRVTVKAPDWAFVPNVTVPLETVNRSYTPNLQGDPLVVAIEFLSATDGGEYSKRPMPPVGKWFFYERILQIPIYAIFDPAVGRLDAYRLNDQSLYAEMQPDASGRVWLPEMDLFLGVWEGDRHNRQGYWLRWWTATGDLLSWGSEQVERQRQQLDSERQRADRLAAKLRELGIDPSTLL